MMYEVNLSRLKNYVHICRYVGQEPELFSGSVLQNVARGRVDLMTSTLPPICEAMAAHEAHCRPRFFPTEFACWPRSVGEQGTADAVDEHSLGIMSKQQKMNEDEHNTGDIELGNSNATCEYKGKLILLLPKQEF